jgi:hypothetical protein
MTTITKTEAKNLLKRRSELFDNFMKLNNNCDQHEGLYDIYSCGRKDISGILHKIDSQLLNYVNQSTVGKWLMQIKGMNTHIAASLITYFDVTDKECAAQFISYAGLDGKKPHGDIGKVIYELKHNFINPNHITWTPNTELLKVLDKKNSKSNTDNTEKEQPVYKGITWPAHVTGIGRNHLKLSDSYYYELSLKKRDELINDGVELATAVLRAERYMMKVFVSHLFEEMYREEYDGQLPYRYNDSDNLIIEPEVPYTK